MFVECGDETFDPLRRNGEQDVYMGSRDLAETAMFVIMRGSQFNHTRRGQDSLPAWLDQDVQCGQRYRHPLEQAGRQAAVAIRQAQGRGQATPPGGRTGGVGRTSGDS